MKKIIFAVYLSFFANALSFAAGALEAISTPYGVSFSGWACDAGSPNDQIEVQIWIDKNYLGSTLANGVREAAVANACGSSHSSHGYSGAMSVPVYMLDGKNYEFHVYGVNGKGGGRFELSNSPQVRQLQLGGASNKTTFLFQQGAQPLTNISAVHWDPALTPRPPEVSIGTFALGTFSTSPNWSVANLTGLSVSPSQSSMRERSVLVNTQSSAIQVDGDRVGIYVHTASAPVDANEPKKVINYIKEWSGAGVVKPWDVAYGENPSLCTGYVSAIPVSTYGPGANNFGSVAFYLFDLASGSVNGFFVYEVVYYYGGGFSQEFVRYDGSVGPGVNAPHVLSYLGGGAQWTSISENSNQVQSFSWSSDKYFGFCISKNQMQAVVNKVNAVNGTNFAVNRLQLNSALIGAEVSTAPYGTNHGSMAARYGQWNVRIMK